MDSHSSHNRLNRILGHLRAERCASTAPLKLGYWGIRGLAAPARMIIAFAGYGDAAYLEDKRYEQNLQAVKEKGKIAGNPEWFNRDKPELLGQISYANLPYLVDREANCTGTSLSYHATAYFLCLFSYSYLVKPYLPVPGPEVWASWQHREGADQKRHVHPLCIWIPRRHPESSLPFRWSK
jgi:hypothetical protein